MSKSSKLPTTAPPRLPASIEQQQRLAWLERFRTLLDHTSEMIFLAALDSRRITDANASACRQLGYEGQDLLGRPIEEVVAMGRLEWPDADDLGGECRTVRTVLHCRDGAEIPVEVLLCLDEFAGCNYLVVVARDISERLRAEEVLRKSEWEKGLILENTDELVVFYDAEMRINWANRTAARSLDLPVERLAGRRCWELWHQRATPCAGCPVIAALNSGEPHSAEITSADGRVWLIRGFPARNPQGDIEGVVELCLDISERKRAEQALRESEERFRTIFEYAAAGMFTLASDGRILQANPAMCRLLGYAEEELRLMTIEQITHPLDLERTRGSYADCMAGDIPAFDYEKRYLCRDGSVVWGHATVTCVRDIDRRPLYCIALVQDITARRRAEDALRESDRIKSEFISTAAHEFRTPLTTILGFAQVLLDQKDLGPGERREFLNYIRQKAEALSETVSDLLDIARIESGQGAALQLQPCNVGELAGELAPLLQNEPYRSRCELHLEEQQTGLLADSGKIVRVFENLLSNAVKYSPALSPVHICGKLLDDCYRFSVADCGIGMNPEQVARVFDKFYRVDNSNTAVAGLGIGMNIVRNIVEGHGGSIWVESEPGRGTTVYFSLPCTRQAQGEGLAG